MSKNAPQTLTLDEVDTLIVFLYNNTDFAARISTRTRNVTMALLMLDSGMRVGELVQLLITDLWFQNEPVNTLSVCSEIAKGHKSREVPLTTRVRGCIDQMNKFWWVDDPHNAGKFAFYGYEANKAITTRQVRRIIANAGYESLHKKVFPHMLRHTFATTLMRKTNARVVQQLLGHRKLSSTQIYCHPNAEDLKMAIDSLDEHARASKPSRSNGIPGANSHCNQF